MNTPAMRRVVLDAPYTGWSWPQLSYTFECMADCMKRREAPMVAHLLYPAAFGPMGMDAGLAWEGSAEAWVVYVDLGFTHNMRKSVERAYRLGRPIIARCLQEQTKGLVERLQPAFAHNVPLMDPTRCTHEVDTPRFDSETPRRLVCWQCACGKNGPSVDEVKAVMREQNG